MTDLIYQTQSYQQQMTATVTAVDEDANGVYLSETIFYPGGGGQPADVGTLTDSSTGTVYNITSAKRGNIHIIEGTLPVVGTEVVGQIDWDRRYKLMRTHTAMHVLCGVVWKDYGALVTGSNMDVLTGRMDFEFERMQKELVQEIEARINEEVANAHDVEIKILPREEAFQIPDLIRTKINLLPEGITEVRTVNLVGLDLQACGGTHLKNTSEIGPIRVTNYKSKGGINKRLYFELEP
ncbi:alanyl-tRNA editing protein [Phototrophicus methaneseepsis]|uniref:Alanyl-tRNA editing protein n=1 Tax=Phototrophicus methaneseepsis TaxID=2710758 RepID=A0A7S8E5L1_9CHLR|nr:alanyl-tRNA editing protein [Phototrophicus methaneseepsis]QPC80723.1 alanyl-tRNA editing protein [Phototrophicus methaneseepsis]